MFYKIYLKSWDIFYPYVIAGSLRVLPNIWGGLRSLEIGEIDTFWTGVDHLQFDPKKQSIFSVQLTGVKSIYQRSTLDETDEEWNCILDPLQHPKTFNYEAYASLAEGLERILEESRSDKST